MLVGRNVVIVKGEKGQPPTVKEYDRVYLEYASSDPLESYPKTTEGKALEVDGKVWKGTRPKDAKTSESAENLLPDALAYFQAKYPASIGKDVTDPDQISQIQSQHAWLTLLEAASYGADLWMRNKIQSEIRPTKPMDRESAIAKMYKLLKSVNPKMSDAKAMAVATASVSDDSEEEQAA